MKFVKTVAVSAFPLSALVSNAASPTLGQDAQGFDIFLLSGTSNDESILEIKDSSNPDSRFNGILGIGEESDTTILNGVEFGSSSEIWLHNNNNGYSNGATVPSGALQTLGVATNTKVEAANGQILDFIDDLNDLADGQAGVTWVDPVELENGPFSFTASTETSVLNFTSITMSNAADTFTLTGGPNDLIVIKISGNTVFEGGAPVTLNGGLDRRNVIWLASATSGFDLHQNDQANFEGIIINPTPSGEGVDVKDDHETIVGGVDFKGQVFAASLKMGTGMNFEGTNVPEPSGHLLVLTAIAGIALRRRR